MRRWIQLPEYWELFFYLIMANDNKFRVNVYIDGFNFYYGLKSMQWRKFYWLDLVKFFECFIKENQVLNKIYYCTARPTHQDKKNRQSAFLKANSRSDKFEVIYGKFLQKEVVFGGQSFTTFEEKQTDVNIAISLIRNIVNNSCDTSIIVSGDSDLEPAIILAKEIDPNHKIYVHFPPNRHSVTLKDACDARIDLGRFENRFKKCLLDAEIEYEGVMLRCPENWV
ncbi:NYN domain-containing protein [Sphingobacterium paludis]|uniref:Uncharacterized LabA/DUF88 family protein n=1 Tax=Sphingobacterium paludis TaxID=1476465 RepID=A0A4R7D4U1_9SPHI|nr:NYN domain-containing protein [Sphingobacterium paludis]TDS14715.1 uncharacterized LabA/DUF88 family protein [Sphingobacterium paludis]